MEGRTSSAGKARPFRWASRALPLFFVSALTTVVLANSGYAVGGRLSILNSPVSDGVKIALAVQSGALKASSGAPGGQRATPFVPSLTVLPNVQASTGSQPSNEVPITGNTANTSQLMSGANDYDCGSLQGFYNSDNGGTTWRQHCMPVVHDSGCGDPAVGYDTTGKAYIMGIDCGFSTGDLVFQTSTDNGLTWSTAKVAFGSLLGGLTDKEWLEVDTSPTSPFKDCVYVSWTDFDSAFTQSRASVAHSCNGGTSWTRVAVDVTQTVPKIDQFTDLAIGPDGTVYVTWMYCKTSGPAGDCGDTDVDMKFSKSTDGGNTWSAPTVMATAHMSPDTSGCYYGCFPGSSERVASIPVIDINDGTGSLHVAFHSYTGGKLRAKYIRSTNGGTTWSAPIEPMPVAGNQGWIWLSASGGHIGITFMHSSAAPNYFEVGAVSGNDGVTFPGKAKLSTVASNFNNDGFGGTFIGDYTGNFWVGNALHASWPDTRSGHSEDETGGVSFP
jgi:hypothetical protein